MALRYLAVSAVGAVSEKANTETTLVAAVQTAVDAAATANAAAGAKADVTTELAAVTTAVTAVTNSIPTGGLVVTLDTSLVTTKNKLRELLDAVFAHVAASNLLT